MNSQLFWVSSFPCLLSVMILVFIEIPLSLSTPELYESCSRLFNCGNITDVGYPFWGEERLSGCGHPDLKLICDENNKTMIEIDNVRYHVMNVNEWNQTLKISRGDFSEICPFGFPDTTLDWKLFKLSPGYENIVLYGCSGPRDLGDVNCSINGVNYGEGYVKLAPEDPRVCNASVTVPLPQKLRTKSTFKNLSRLEQTLNDGFEVKWKVDNTACRECVGSNGTCAYGPYLYRLTCYCPNSQPIESKICSPTPPGEPPENQKGNGSNGKNLGIGLAVGGVVGIFLGCWLLVIIHWRRKKAAQSTPPSNFDLEKKSTNFGTDNFEAFIKSYGTLTLKRYSYLDVIKMTKSLIDKLGQGGYGSVYKGKLPDGRPIAVKILSELKGNGEEFINEVASISRTSHVNIVTLVGFCYEKTKRALIYEFMPNGSLDKFIYDEESSHTCHNLQWETLYHIAIGIGRGLDYLHRGCNIRIVHFDIKPHNILLDEDFCPKISDFGLAKLCKRKESIVSMVGARGTAGYIAPEVFCRSFGGVSHKSDVYSYGMMVLEMVGGRKNINVGVSNTSEIYFPQWIYKQLEPGKDLRLHSEMTEEEEETARKMIIVSLWCIQMNPSDRPSITKVVEMLEGSLQSLQIPPMPILSSPRKSPQHHLHCHRVFTS